MPRRHIHLNQQERVKLILRLLGKEAPATVLAREAGISESTLYQWRDKFISGGTQQLVPDKRGQKEIARLKKELVERNRIIGELTVVNTVLKKVQGVQSDPPVANDD